MKGYDRWIDEAVDQGLSFEVQVSGNGDTIWVHASDGSTVGRFSKRFGIDLHTTAVAQMAGADQCLMCTHGAAGEEEWARFREGMLKHYGFVVPASALAF